MTASVGYEYDDNVAAPEIDSTSEQGASAGVFELGGEIGAYRGEAFDFDLGYDFYQSLYSENDASDLDLRLHLPWWILSTEYGALDLDFSWRGSFAHLGEDEYFQTQSLGPAVGFLLGESFYLTSSYTYQYRDFARSHPLVSSTNDRSGHRHSIRSGVAWLPREPPVSLRGAFLYRVEDATQNHEFDYTSIGFRLGGEWTLPIPGIGYGSPEMQLQLAFDARKFAGDSRSLTDVGVRRDERTNFSLALELPLYRALFGRLVFEHLNSNSNDPDADYKSNAVRLQIEARL